MIVSIQLSPEDVRKTAQEHQFYLQHRFADPTPSRVYWMLFAPFTLVIIAVVGNSFPFAIFACGLIWTISNLGNRWYRRRFAKIFYTATNLTVNLLPVQLELLPDRFTVSSTASVHHYFWHGFQFLRETPGYFYLFSSPISSLAVPKSAFGSDTERDAFRNAIKDRRTASDSRCLPGRAKK